MNGPLMYLSGLLTLPVGIALVILVDLVAKHRAAYLEWKANR